MQNYYFIMHVLEILNDFKPKLLNYYYDYYYFAF